MSHTSHDKTVRLKVKNDPSRHVEVLDENDIITWHLPSALIHNVQEPGEEDAWTTEMFVYPQTHMFEIEYEHIK
jgi:hypothetical protein